METEQKSVESTSNNQIEISKIYDEACSASRHYSISIRTIRTITIAQSFAILSAVGYLAKEEQFHLSIFVGIFGLVLTAILYNLHRHYFNLAFAAFEYVQELERKNFPNGQGVWVKVAKARSHYWSKTLLKFGVKDAIFILLFVAIIGMIVYSALQM